MGVNKKGTDIGIPENFKKGTHIQLPPMAYMVQKF